MSINLVLNLTHLKNIVEQLCALPKASIEFSTQLKYLEKKIEQIDALCKAQYGEDLIIEQIITQLKIIINSLKKQTLKREISNF